MKILLFCLLLSTFGCVKNVDKASHSLLLSDADREILNKECHEIEQIGSLKEYMKFIKLEMNVILHLIDQYNEGDDNISDEIEMRGKKVSDTIELVQRLIGKEYNIPRWNYEVKWQITKDDFRKFIGNYLPHGFEMTWIKPHSASIFGERNDTLLNGLSFRFGKKTASFTYQGFGSSLSVCQLGKTRMLLMEVHYKHLGRNNKRFFNLIHR